MTLMTRTNIKVDGGRLPRIPYAQVRHCMQILSAKTRRSETEMPTARLIRDNLWHGSMYYSSYISVEVFVLRG